MVLYRGSNRDVLLPLILSLNNVTKSGESGMHSNLVSQSLVDANSESTEYRRILTGIDGISTMPSGGIGPCLDMVFRLMKTQTNRTVNKDLFR